MPPKRILRKGRADAAEAARELPEQISENHVWRIYHLSQVGCSQHTLPQPKTTNCHFNPYCLQRIGIEKFEKAIKTHEVDHKKAEKDLEERNLVEKPCGLLNSGNFCYVNSFLQIWFNDPHFRQIIFDWRPSEEYISPEPPRLDVQKVMNCLQKLFYLLQYSPLDTCAVKEFTSALRLGNEQQDAQEFSLMFFDALDRHLLNHPNGLETRNRIVAHLQGSTTQRITCRCGRDSKTETMVQSLPLSIDNTKTLTDMLQRYFATEDLEDYMCDQCGERGHVQRHLEMERFPQVLLLQINRYQFDANNRNKKIKTAVQFPQELEGDALRPGSDRKTGIKYDLCAVMIHEGERTEYGHYYDIIWRSENDKWYQYNDEVVTEAKRPGVSIENAKNPPSKPGQDLKSCYGLVYRQRKFDPEYNMPPPEELWKAWEREAREEFNEKSGRTLQESLEGLEEMKRRQKTVSSLFAELQIIPNKENEYINKKDLISFLPTRLMIDLIEAEYRRGKAKYDCVMEKVKGLTPTIKDPDEEALAAVEDTTHISRQSKRLTRKRMAEELEEKKRFFVERMVISKHLGTYNILLCSHGKVDIEQMIRGDVKIVDATAVEELLDRYRILMHYEKRDPPKHRTLRGWDVCRECVEELRHEAYSMEQIERDDKLASTVLKEEKIRCPTRVAPAQGFYYVSKKALQAYKKRALKEEECRRKLHEQTSNLVFYVESSAGITPSTSQMVTSKRIRTASHSASPTVNGGTCENAASPGSTMEVVGEEKATCSSPEAAFDQDVSATLESMLENVTANVDGVEENGTDASNKKMNGHRRSPTPIAGTSNGHSTPGEDMENMEFNHELRCAHGNLNREGRLAVSPEEWERLRSNFRAYYDVPVSSPNCSECEYDAHVKTLDSEELSYKVEQLVTQLPELIKGYEGRRHLSKTVLKRDYPFLVCNRFLEKLLKFSKAGRNRRLVTSFDLCQKCVLCESHGLPFISIDPEVLKDMAYLIPIKRKEWEVIAEVMGRGDISPPQEILYTEGDIVDFCHDCHGHHLQAYNAKQFTYRNGTVYVKLQNDLQEAPTTGQTTRRAAAKHLLKVKMDSSDTVRGMKVKLYQLTQHSPNDQMLMHSGMELDDDSTLEALRILPNNQETPVILVAQTYNGNVALPDEPRAPERGFSDTALAH
ncbi:unnamed protein product, partial [Mesorhabditis spiculigera]